MSTVAEIKAAIETLSPAERVELEHWLHGAGAGRDDESIPVHETDLDPEVDSPELEAQLLKAIDGPYTPYSSEGMRKIVERIIHKEERK